MLMGCICLEVAGGFVGFHFIGSLASSMNSMLGNLVIKFLNFVQKWDLPGTMLQLIQQYGSQHHTSRVFVDYMQTSVRHHSFYAYVNMHVRLLNDSQLYNTILNSIFLAKCNKKNNLHVYFY